MINQKIDAEMQKNGRKNYGLPGPLKDLLNLIY